MNRKEINRIIRQPVDGPIPEANMPVIGEVLRSMYDDIVVLNIADEVMISIQKGSISGVLPKGTIKSI